MYQRFLWYTSSSGAEFPPSKMLHDIPVKYLGASSRGKLSELENAPSCVLTQNEPGAFSGSKTPRVYRPLRSSGTHAFRAKISPSFVVRSSKNRCWGEKRTALQFIYYVIYYEKSWTWAGIVFFKLLFHFLRSYYFCLSWFYCHWFPEMQGLPILVVVVVFFLLSFSNFLYFTAPDFKQ